MTPRDSVRSEVLERVAESPSAISAIQGTRGGLDAATGNALRALLAAQQPEGHWCYELEADCTIPAEYVLMMHYLDEIDSDLEQRLARYLRARQVGGGWSLYPGGAFDLSCSVKAYYALKLVGDDPQQPHMAAARAAILGHDRVDRVSVGAARRHCAHCTGDRSRRCRLRGLGVAADRDVSCHRSCGARACAPLDMGRGHYARGQPRAGTHARAS